MKNYKATKLFKNTKFFIILIFAINASFLDQVSSHTDPHTGMDQSWGANELPHDYDSSDYDVHEISGTFLQEDIRWFDPNDRSSIN